LVIANRSNTPTERDSWIFLLLLGTTRQDSSDSRGPCGVVLGRNPTVSLGWSVAAIGYYQKALVRNMGVSPDKTTQLKS
jgi:hypothetical protein